MISKNPVYLDIPISIIFSIMNVGVVLCTAFKYMSKFYKPMQQKFKKAALIHFTITQVKELYNTIYVDRLTIINVHFELNASFSLSKSTPDQLHTYVEIWGASQNYVGYVTS